MAEFRAAQSGVEQLSAQLTLLQERVRSSIDEELKEETALEMQSALQQLQAATTGDLNASMDKYRERCAMVDPITSESRFGPKMMARVRGMLDQYDKLKNALETTELVVQVDSILRIWAQKRQAQEQSQALLKQQQEEEERRMKEADLEAQRLAEALELQRREQEQLKEQRRIADLAQVAERVRQKRDLERQQEVQRLADEKAQREALNASIERWIPGLQAAIDMLQESTESQVLYRKALQQLHRVVATICASPENSLFRRIPKDNANFHEDLGQFNGGHQSLLALGFRELEPEEGKFVFIMEEPDLSADLDAWSDWFDGLKDMKEFIEAKLG